MKKSQSEINDLSIFSACYLFYGPYSEINLSEFLYQAVKSAQGPLYLGLAAQLAPQSRSNGSAALQVQD